MIRQWTPLQDDIDKVGDGNLHSVAVEDIDAIGDGLCAGQNIRV